MELRKSIAAKDGVAELLQSENMRPYIRLHVAASDGQRTIEQLLEFCDIPLEKRYLWRIVSALKWAFVDYDSVSVVLDRTTLSSDDVATCRRDLQPSRQSVLPALNGTIRAGKDGSVHAGGDPRCHAKPDCQIQNVGRQ